MSLRFVRSESVLFCVSLPLPSVFLCNFYASAGSLILICGKWPHRFCILLLYTSRIVSMTRKQTIFLRDCMRFHPQMVLFILSYDVICLAFHVIANGDNCCIRIAREIACCIFYTCSENYALRGGNSTYMSSPFEDSDADLVTIFASAFHY